MEEHEKGTDGVSEMASPPVLWSGRWQQHEDGPTEEERLAWEDQQQQREKLSGLMGQYLLKGYRMLDSTCAECGNILMRTRGGVDYCVYCIEIQGKSTPRDNGPLPHPPTGTDDPTALPPDNEVTPIPAEEPHPQTIEGSSVVLPASTDSHNQPQVNPVEPVSVSRLPDASGVSVSEVRRKHGHEEASSGGLQSSVFSSRDALLRKLQWATKELASTTSVEHSIQLCQLIKACAEALESIENLKPLHTC